MRAWFASMVSLLCFLWFVDQTTSARANSPQDATEARSAASDAELRFWLENMVWHHRFTREEIAAATGLGGQQIDEALRRFSISEQSRPKRVPGAPLLVLPYPGGRHPRIGFLEGAIRPQRETKISVFAPWDYASYVVADIPEAIWSNLGLTYLAHTHVSTVWTKQDIELDKLEWSRLDGGELEFARTLPNGIRFGTKVTPLATGVRMAMWLTNGTRETLTDLRVQNCVMLKGAAGFEDQTVDNKVFAAPYAARKARDADRWVITAWVPNHRTWSNAKCPCLHSDPKFDDCPPGETQRLRGWLSFYEGTDIAGEFKRLDANGWREAR